jgi:hypothetical protein
MGRIVSVGPNNYIQCFLRLHELGAGACCVNVAEFVQPVDVIESEGRLKVTTPL